MDPRDQRPRARTDDLLVEEVDQETLVYNLATHGAHCLNPAAALIWRSSDGGARIRDMVSLLPEVGLPEDESVIWMALDGLAKAGLVERVDLPAPRASFSRKEVLRVIGAAAAMTLLLPAVDSVTAPLAAQAASCTTSASCDALKGKNCTGLPICENRTLCCISKGKGCAARAC